MSKLAFHKETKLKRPRPLRPAHSINGHSILTAILRAFLRVSGSRKSEAHRFALGQSWR